MEGVFCYCWPYANLISVLLSYSHPSTSQRKTANPVFEQNFRVPVPSSLALNEENRLQLAVWDSARMKANECMGGMSFSLRDIASKSSITGWYTLLPYNDGRYRYESTSATASPSAARRRSQPTLPAVGSSLGTTEVNARSASPPPQNGDDKAASSAAPSSASKASPKWHKPSGSKAQLQKQVGPGLCVARP